VETNGGFGAPFYFSRFAIQVAAKIVQQLYTAMDAARMKPDQSRHLCSSSFSLSELAAALSELLSAECLSRVGVVSADGRHSSGLILFRLCPRNYHLAHARHHANQVFVVTSAAPLPVSSFKRLFLLQVPHDAQWHRQLR
jgi:hypothetical protein